MPAALAAAMIADACDALEYAHELKIAGEHLTIVHRDVKPGNLTLCEDGRIKIIDFVSLLAVIVLRTVSPVRSAVTSAGRRGT